jgi:hypothetical protein
VLNGEVAVTRKNETENVLVGPGQGVDIDMPPGAPRSVSPHRPDPIAVKQWGPARVKELLDRFGP